VSYQVLVKTTAVMNGAYTYLLETAEERAEFVRRPDIFWYHFPEEDDDWQWHRGGAWKPAHQLTPEDLEAKPPLPWDSHPGMVNAEDITDDEEEDERW
jgi:hypothetical protein